MRTLYEHGFIYTADRDWRSFSDGAMFVQDEYIKWVGNYKDWLEIADQPDFIPDSSIDMREKIIFPGLINSHTHSGMSAMRGLYDDGDLFEWAKHLSPVTSQLTKEDLRLGSYLGIMEQISTGTTCVCDCTRFEAGMYAQIAAETGIRSVSGALVNSPELRRDGRSNWPAALNETEDALVKLSGSNRNRLFLGAHSPYNCTPELVQEVKHHADRLDLLFNIHVSENKKEVELIKQKYGVKPVIWLDQLNVLDENTLIDHAVWLDDEEIEILKQRRVSVAHCPISNAKLASGVAPVRKFLQSGVTVGLATDGNLSNNTLDMFQEMKFAVLIQRAKHLDGHALSARDTIEMATRGSARAVGLDNSIGDLSPGKQADFIILEYPVPRRKTIEWVESDIVFAAGRQTVESVVVAGERIYHQGHFTKIDQDAILAEVQARYQ